MTRETKIGLLVGLGVILFFAILVSEFISVANTQQTPHLDQLTEQPVDPAPTDTPVVTRRQPLPTPGQTTAASNEQDPLTRPFEFRIPEFQRNIHSLSQTDTPQRNTPPAESQRNTIPQNTFVPDRLVINTRGDVTRHDNTTTQSGDRWHTVRDGESLSAISLKYYGDRNYYHTIYEANRDRMSSPNDVMVGVRLLIPKRNGSTTTTQTTTPRQQPRPQRSSTPSTGYIEYTIQSGDTLSEIAQKHLGSVRHAQRIIDLNRKVIKNPDNVPAGVVIKIPRD